MESLERVVVFNFVRVVSGELRKWGCFVESGDLTIFEKTWRKVLSMAEEDDFMILSECCCISMPLESLQTQRKNKEQAIRIIGKQYEGGRARPDPPTL